MDVPLNPMDPEFLADPYPTYARLRDQSGIPRHPGGFFVASRYDDVQSVLKHPEIYSSAAMGGVLGAGNGAASRRAGRRGDVPSDVPIVGSLISQDPPLHTSQRNIVNRGFTPRRVAGLEGRIQGVVDDLFSAFEGRGRAELIDEFAGPLPVVVIAEMLGLPPERRDDFRRWSNALIVGSTSFDAATPGRRTESQRLMREFAEALNSYIQERRAAPGDDLVSVLVDAADEGDSLTPRQVLSFTSLLLAAGSETTMNLIGNAVKALDERPELMSLLREDPTRVPDVLEETLRWDSPVQLLMRLTTQDTELAGTEVPKGSMMMTFVGAANRDEARFPEAEVFDPDRNTQGHLAFGFGNHFCLGASLARLEARCALEAILSRLHGLRIADPGAERHGSFLIRGIKRLPVTFAP